MEWAEAIPIVLTIVALEALLSADNAMVLAVIVKPLSDKERPRAMFWGLMGALALRAVAIGLAVYLIHLWWVEVLGGLYLMYLTVNHFIQLRNPPPDESTQTSQAPRRVSFWSVVLQLNVVNLAFSVDSILVVVAVTQSYPLIIIGAFLGMALIWLAASWLVRLLDRYPALESVAYLLVGWAGLKLALEGWSGFSESIAHHEDWAVHLSQGFFLSVTAAIFVLGLWYVVRRGR
ncbi:MAG: hypothetical protein C4331_15945 [Meiothermus sp.]